MLRLTPEEHNDGRLAAIALGVEERKAAKAEIRKLREEGKLLKKGAYASPNSGRRKRKLARKNSRPIQEVVPKPEFKRLRPVEEAGEVPQLHTRVRNKVRKNKATVSVKHTRTTKKPVFGSMKGHSTKSVYDQVRLDKVHKPHEVGFKMKHTNACLALLRQVFKDAPVLTVPVSYTGAGGKQHVMYVEKPIVSYRKHDAVTVDRVNGNRTRSLNQLARDEERLAARAKRKERIAKRAAKKAAKKEAAND